MRLVGGDRFFDQVNVSSKSEVSDEGTSRQGAYGLPAAGASTQSLRIAGCSGAPRGIRIEQLAETREDFLEQRVFAAAGELQGDEFLRRCGIDRRE